MRQERKSKRAHKKQCVRQKEGSLDSSEKEPGAQRSLGDFALGETKKKRSDLRDSCLRCGWA